MGYIYKITNSVNQKVYIGQTKKTIEERFQAHIKKAKLHINRYLYDAMNKYGYDNFIIEEIEQCADSQLDEREIYWIAFYKSNNKNYGYNMTEGGGGGNTWSKNPHKEDTSRKISEHNKGKHSNPKVIQKMVAAAKEANTIKVNKEELERDIKSFLSVEEICKKYNISRRTFYIKCKKYFNATPTEIRGDKLTHTNSTKIQINMDQLHQLLLQGKSLQEMADYFGISKETVRKNIVSQYGKKLREVRKDVKSKN